MKRAYRYRFFFHYRKVDGKLTVHYRGQCVPCEKIVCIVPCSSKRRKTQPHVVMEGFSSSVRKIGKAVYIT